MQTKYQVSDFVKGYARLGAEPTRGSYLHFPPTNLMYTASMCAAGVLYETVTGNFVSEASEREMAKDLKISCDALYGLVRGFDGRPSRDEVFNPLDPDYDDYYKLGRDVAIAMGLSSD